MGSFGDKLRRERDLRGISLREIAERTKISVRFLQALEEDRVDVLPGGLFPRAFVKQYALFLGLDAEKTVADFVAAHGEAPPERRRPPLRSGGCRCRSARSSSPSWWSWRSPSPSGAGARPSAPGPSRRPRRSRRRPPCCPPTGCTRRPRLAPASAAASDSLVLTMTAQQDCWVEVRADGQTVVNRVLAEGESQTFEARGEIVLSVGNAGGLSIRVNDRPALPLGRSGEVRKNIVITRQNLPSLVQQDGAAEPDGHSG